MLLIIPRQNSNHMRGTRCHPRYTEVISERAIRSLTRLQPELDRDVIASLIKSSYRFHDI